MWTRADHKAENRIWQTKLKTTVTVPFNSYWGLGALLSCIMSTKLVEPPPQHRPLLLFNIDFCRAVIGWNWLFQSVCCFTDWLWSNQLAHFCCADMFQTDDYPAEKTANQHQNATYVGLASDLSSARPAHVMFWFWSLFVFQQGNGLQLVRQTVTFMFSCSCCFHSVATETEREIL